MSQGTSQGILADLKSLQRQVKGRLAEQEVELGELGHADTQLVQLETDLELVHAAPETWIPERQALVDQIEELSRAHALGEARSRQALKAQSENAQRLNQELHQTGGELVRAQEDLAEREAAYQVEQAGWVQQRDQLAAALEQAQQQLATLQAEQQRQGEQRTTLLSRVQGLDEELRSLRSLQPELTAPGPAESAPSSEAQRGSVQAQAAAVRRQLAQLRADHQRVSQERAALMARVGQLEQAVQAGPASVPAPPEAWQIERDQALGQMARLEQALQSRNQNSMAERNRMIAELNAAHEQLSQLAGREPEWRQLWEERATLEARVQQ